jgi:hypothetical protein
MNAGASNELWLWDKVVEVYKARISVSLAFVVATVSLAGYAIANKWPRLALLTATIPLLALAIDTLLLYKIATPFLYKLFSSRSEVEEAEPLALLFLAFGATASAFREVWSMPAGVERQRRFRSAYLKEEVPIRAAVFGLASVGNVLLWILVRG